MNGAFTDAGGIAGWAATGAVLVAAHIVALGAALAVVAMVQQAVNLAQWLLKGRSAAIAEAAAKVLETDLAARSGAIYDGVITVSRQGLGAPWHGQPMEARTRDAIRAMIPWWHGLVYRGLTVRIEPAPASATLRAAIAQRHREIHGLDGGAA